MSDNVTVTLTRSQATRLRTLVIDEAWRKGYGVKYNEYNKRAWPSSLKRLTPIARKLYDALHN